MAAEKPLKLQIIRLPSRERHIIPSLPPSTSISHLQSLISDLLSLSPSSQSLFNGFPPKEIDLDTDAKRSRTLAEVGIKNGDTIEVRVREAPTSSSPIPDVPEMKQGRGWEYPPTTEKGSMQRKVMPSDNSCLFHSVAYVCSNKATGPAAAAHVREVVANLVASDPARYSTIFLGSPNGLYQQHILNTDTWGGAIELSILSTHFETEVVAFDYHYLREDVFGRGEGYKRRVFLLYTGDHYDAMVWVAQGGAEQVVFSTKDDNAWLSARSYISSLHGEGARSGKWELQSDWRSGEGLKKRDGKNAEKERVKKANALQEERKREEEKAVRETDSKRKSSGARAEQKDDGDGWKCSHCTLQNSRSSMTCVACGAPVLSTMRIISRPHPLPTSPHPPPLQSKGPSPNPPKRPLPPPPHPPLPPPLSRLVPPLVQRRRSLLLLLLSPLPPRPLSLRPLLVEDGPVSPAPSSTANPALDVKFAMTPTLMPPLLLSTHSSMTMESEPLCPNRRIS